MQTAGLNLAPGAIVTSFDFARNIVLIKAHGQWTPAQVDRSFWELEALRLAEPSRVAGIRVLVDRRDAVVQSAETAERLKARTKTFYKDGDRVAVVVDTSLAKLQLRRVLDERTHKIFISENAAIIWLTAFDP